MLVHPCHQPRVRLSQSTWGMMSYTSRLARSVEIKPYKTLQNNLEHRPENREDREEPKCNPDLHTLRTQEQAMEA